MMNQELISPIHRSSFITRKRGSIMTAEISTVIDQLSISEGKWRSHTPNQVAVREPKAADAPGSGKGDLFIITEIQGDVTDRDGLEQRLAHLIRDSYYLSSGSITA